MSDSSNPAQPSRRDFLTGRSARDAIQRAGDAAADAIVESANSIKSPPAGGDRIRLSTDAMACRFAVILNPDPGHQCIAAASRSLDLVHELESQMSVYRPESELSRINATAADKPASVERGLFELLKSAAEIGRETGGAFDPTSGPLIALWRRCRDEGRIPADDEIAAELERTGVEHVTFDETASTVRFDRSGVEFNLGGVGKGYALDRISDRLSADGVDDYLLHGGYSSLLARGDHNRQGGWPVGIRNPLFTNTRLGVILLKDVAMSTSGSSVQHFRHQGRKYGHLLDPRTGRPSEGLLSVTVLASTAALADALSTAFFVTGVENTCRYCDNHEGVAALLIPPPKKGRTLDPIVCGIPEDVLFL